MHREDFAPLWSGITIHVTKQERRHKQKATPRHKVGASSCVRAEMCILFKDSSCALVEKHHRCEY